MILGNLLAQDNKAEIISNDLASTINKNSINMEEFKLKFRFVYDHLEADCAMCVTKQVTTAKMINCCGESFTKSFFKGLECLMTAAFESSSLIKLLLEA